MPPLSPPPKSSDRRLVASTRNGQIFLLDEGRDQRTTTMVRSTIVVVEKIVRSFKTRSATSRSPVVHATADDGYKVAVLGRAAGGIGALSLLLKMNPMISDLALYDVGEIVKGVAVDLSHCNTASTVNGYCGNEELGHWR